MVEGQAVEGQITGNARRQPCRFRHPGPRFGQCAARGFEARSPVPYHDAENGGRNVLLENFGEFRFADVTDEVGLDRGGTRWSSALTVVRTTVPAAAAPGSRSRVRPSMRRATMSRWGLTRS